MWKYWKQSSFLNRVNVLLVLSLGTLIVGCHADEINEEDLPPKDPHRNPSLCEVCKFLTTEVKGRLTETGKTREVLEIGYGLDQKKKRKEYRKSELRLIEVINDPHVCDKILEYNVHAERKGSNRFAKGRSQTMETLHGLVHKGVNVELGIPYEMWDIPSAGVTEMQRQCFKIVEDYEEDIEEWYWNYQDHDFTKFLCEDRVLKDGDQVCLSEIWTEEQKKKKAKRDKEKGDVPDQQKTKKSSKKDKKLKGDVGTEEPEVEEKAENKMQKDKVTVEAGVEEKDDVLLEAGVEEKDEVTLEAGVEEKDEVTLEAGVEEKDEVTLEAGVEEKDEL